MEKLTKQLRRITWLIIAITLVLVIVLFFLIEFVL